MSYPQITEKIQQELNRELGITFSLGVSVTKTLAKIGSKWKKPAGLTIISLRDAKKYLKALPVGAVWGIGPQTAALLNKYGVRTALDFVSKDEAWVKSKVSKPFYETWLELSGTVASELNVTGRETYQSISKTKTFTPPSNDRSFVHAQLSKNIENACSKARRWKLSAPAIFFFLKTQDFRYHGYEIKLPYPTANPIDMLREIDRYFDQVFKKNTLYRATGIVLVSLVEEGTQQLDLFGALNHSNAVGQIFENADKLAERYGKHVVFLGSSFEAMRSRAHLGDRGDLSDRAKQLFKGETKRRRLAIPMLGEVH
jgi:DNA polymerase-4/DNA polymerase V